MKKFFSEVSEAIDELLERSSVRIDKLKGIITEKTKRVSKLSQKPKFQNKEFQII
jgi:hypothetical protein